MSYANILPRKDAIRPLPKAATTDPALRATKPAFFFLLVFTALLYGRPGDMVPLLRPIHMAEIGAILMCLTYLVARLGGVAPFLWSTELKLMCALTVLFVVGVPFAFWRGGSFEVLTQNWLKVLLIFLLLTQTALSLARVRKLLWVIILCVLVVCAVSVSTGQVVIERGGRAMGATVGFLSGNFLGIAVATMLPYMAAFTILSRSMLKTGLLIATLGLSSWMVVLTASRGGLLCVLFSFVFIWVLVLRGSMRAQMMRLVFFVVLFATIASAPGILWDRFRTVWDPSDYATSAEATSALESEYHRKIMLRRSIEYTFRWPIFGTGLGNFTVASGTVTGRASEWKGSHNTYTQVSSEAGIPAFILFVWLLYSSLRNARRVTKQCAKNPAHSELGLISRATMASLWAFMFGGFFAHLAYDYYLYYLIGISVALRAEAQRSLGTVPQVAPQETLRPAVHSATSAL